MRIRPNQHRRGIVLIVVLGLLALFSLMSITFLMTTEQDVKSAIAISKVEQREDPGDTLLERALTQVLVGSTNELSVLQQHSLLEDLYGPPLINSSLLQAPSYGYLGAADNSAGFLHLELTDAQLASSGGPFRELPGCYNGCVITMLSGNCAGKSSRILRYYFEPSAGSWVLRLLPFEGMEAQTSGGSVQWSPQSSPGLGDRFLINSMPFNGMGFGFHATKFAQTGLTNLTAADLGGGSWAGLENFELALLPNPRTPEWQSLLNPTLATRSIAPVHADEDYDAVDYQNMLLALHVNAAPEVRSRNSNFVSVPSLHRPSLINYWLNHPEYAALSPLAQRALRRRCILRPLAEDHPEFAAMNPSFNLLNGPWDVDNDGDGQPDSVWVDLGFEVFADEEGRHLKPLVAVFARDLDSKLNLNIHGQGNEYYDDRSGGGPRTVPIGQKAAYHVREGSGISLAGAQGITNPSFSPNPLASTGREVRLAPGLGLSPAEITLTPYTVQHANRPDNHDRTNDANGSRNPRWYWLLTEAEFRSLLYGRTSQKRINGEPTTNEMIIPGRYGEAGMAGRYPRPGRSLDVNGQTNHASRSQGDDNFPPEPTRFVKTLPSAGTRPHGGFIPSSIMGDNSVPRSNLYGSPFDLDANGAIAVDPSGRPRFLMMGVRNSNNRYPENINDPTEFNVFEVQHYQQEDSNGVSKVVLADEPFTPRDLEWLVNAQQSYTSPIRRTDLEVNDARNTLNKNSAGYSPAWYGNDSSPNEYARRSSGLTAQGTRLYRLLGAMVGTADRFFRQSILTTESWDIPVHSATPTPEMVKGLELLGLPASDRTFADLVMAKLAYVRNVNGQPVDPVEIRNLYLQLVSVGALDFDLTSGLKLDINRPLGNGFDDDNDGVVDENDEIGLDSNGDGIIDPSEATERVFGTYGVAGSGVPVDRIPDGVIRVQSIPGNDATAIQARLTNPSDTLARSMLARQLYFLLMLVKDYQYVESVEGEGSYSAAELRELTARRLAQWAINAVDFRDQDNIMTPFEYDVDPFDGWSVDGDIRTDDQVVDPGNGSLSVNPQRRVVWGSEQPLLVISETLAAHDLRIDDTEDEQPDEELVADGDNDWDQIRIPQGDAFVELLCMSNQHNLRVAGDLFDASGRLLLDKTANGSPVWRLVYTKPSVDNGEGDPDFHLSNRMDYTGTGSGRASTGSLEPRQSVHHPDLPAPYNGWPVEQQYPYEQEHFTLRSQYNAPTGAQFRGIEPSRYVYFVPGAGYTQGTWGVREEERKRIFARNGATAPHLGSGQYAMIGSAGRLPNQTTTLLGRASDPANGVATADLLGFEFGGNFQLSKNANPFAPYDAVGNEIRAVLGIPCSGLDTVEITTAMGQVEYQIGLNISEPFYDPANAVDDWYASELTGQNLLDTDYDPYGTVIPDRLETPADRPFDDDNQEIHIGGGLGVGTILEFSNVFLQRLADPTRPWHPIENPYLSVDWMPVDLTVYNSPADVPDTDGTLNKTAQMFRTRERGAKDAAGRDPWARIDIWSQLGNFREINPTDDETTEAYFPQAHSLGYLNSTFGTRITAANEYGGYQDTNLLGYPSEYPFPWFAWNNRPYVSGLELLQVPASSPARLLWEFSPYEKKDGNRGGFYQFEHASHPANANVRLGGTPYRHLLNFFYSGPTNANAFSSPPPNPVSNYHRLFEFVTVPSRFSGTKRWLDPDSFQAGNQAAPGELAGMVAPFNYISKYREPGKVNLNTISDSTNVTWYCLMNSSPTDSPWSSGPDNRQHIPFSAVRASLRGYPAASAWHQADNPQYPTLFANPLRAYTSSGYVPIDRLRQGGTGYRLTADASLLRPLRDVDGSLLGIEDPFDDFPEQEYTPLFGNNHPYHSSLYQGQLGPFNDPRRHSFFQFHPIQRLGNLVTNRSNVYAVWITIGYFEVEKLTPDPGMTAEQLRNFQEAYPDGWRIGREAGLDRGRPQRHRGFYLIDRSIPVAFERGKLHNALDTLLLKRQLE